MTSNNNETQGQTKQRHKLELRGSDGNALKERQEIKAFETEEENTTTLISHTNEAAEAASLATKQAEAQAKAHRKREKKKQERERRERIDEANENTVSEREIEADMILAQLLRYGLKIKDIPSDGHCMYHAVADQIKQKDLPIVD
ncbi:hypothetical protein PsorP6_005131 [Peronosclerospora sorghi]|uniref:Uncharacterized protein n=1 Tax=Peronosclerospora sorghi TaxID=230839 RepID=A0ACC0W6T8_9STRA|nr:hypothetical protein PsorP6_005131 [Peronosclerospora sorghi]